MSSRKEEKSGTAGLCRTIRRCTLVFFSWPMINRGHDIIWWSMAVFSNQNVKESRKTEFCGDIQPKISDKSAKNT
jgi:hypothetical protein